jgi:hypothetical protein
MGVNLDDEPLGHLSNRPPTTISQTSRSFTFRGLTRRDTRKDDAPDSKGPIGLTTVWNPSDGVADIVFVHGLNGGSQSTWSYNGDLSTFWPGEWLPEDSAFQDVRIHSFGYNSAWSQESMLNINDFAQSLLASIQDSPAIPREQSVWTRHENVSNYS